MPNKGPVHDVIKGEFLKYIHQHALTLVEPKGSGYLLHKSKV